MDMKCKNAFIINKKISPFARAVNRDNRLLLGNKTFGSPCIFSMEIVHLSKFVSVRKSESLLLFASFDAQGLLSYL
jgi:hypothetical protein